MKHISPKRSCWLVRSIDWLLTTTHRILTSKHTDITSRQLSCCTSGELQGFIGHWRALTSPSSSSSSSHTRRTQHQHTDKSGHQHRAVKQDSAADTLMSSLGAMWRCRRGAGRRGFHHSHITGCNPVWPARILKQRQKTGHRRTAPDLRRSTDLSRCRRDRLMFREHQPQRYLRQIEPNVQEDKAEQWDVCSHDVCFVP